MKINLDPVLESAVEVKLIEMQSLKKWNIQQNISVIQKQIELIQQYAQNNITVIYANATANATLIQIKAEAQATKYEYEGYASAYATLNNLIQFTDYSAFIGFIFAEVYGKLGNTTFLDQGQFYPYLQYMKDTF